MTAPVLTVAEACEALAVSRATFWRMIKRGDIKVSHIGTGKRPMVRVRQSEIERVLGPVGVASAGRGARRQ